MYKRMKTGESEEREREKPKRRAVQFGRVVGVELS